MTVSPTPGPWVASSRAAQSRTRAGDDVLDAEAALVAQRADGDAALADVFSPTRPQNEAGMRIEPPPSEAWAAGTSPAATAAAEPPDDPPGVRPRSHGLWVGPKASGLGRRQDAELGACWSGPTITRPAARYRATSVVSAGAGSPPPSAPRCRCSGSPSVAAHRSLIEERDAAERTVRQVAGRRGSRARSNRRWIDRVQRRVDGLDALDGGLDELGRRDLALATSSAWAVASSQRVSSAMRLMAADVRPPRRREPAGASWAMPRSPTACPLDCPDTCSLEVTVDDGRITKVDAAPGNPFTQGYICQKVKHHAERVYGPERVLTPLVRTGPKGAGEFRAGVVGRGARPRRRPDRRRAGDDGAGPSRSCRSLYNSSAGVLAAAGLTERLFRRLGAAEVARHHLRGHRRRGRGTSSSAACSPPTRSTSCTPA